jgi:hypothetical protein
MGLEKLLMPAAEFPIFIKLFQDPSLVPKIADGANPYVQALQYCNS